MQAERKPYELLVRWDTDGNLLGAHVQWSNVVTNDDGSKQIYPTTVEPVALGDLFLQRVGAMLTMRGRGHFSDADVSDVAKLALIGLAQQPAA